MNINSLILEYLNDIPGASSRGIADCHDKIVRNITITDDLIKSIAREFFPPEIGRYDYELATNMLLELRKRMRQGPPANDKIKDATANDDVGEAHQIELDRCKNLAAWRAR